MQAIFTTDAVKLSLNPNFGFKKETVTLEGVEVELGSGEALLEHGDQICKALLNFSESEILERFKVSTTAHDETARAMAKESSQYVQKYLSGNLFRNAIFAGFKVLKQIIENKEEVSLNPSKVDEYRTLQGVSIIVESYLAEARDTYIDASRKLAMDKTASELESFLENPEAKKDIAKFIESANEKSNQYVKKFALAFFSGVDSKVHQFLYPLHYLSDLPDPSRKLKAFSEKFKDLDVKIEIDFEVYNKYVTDFENATQSKIKELTV